MDGQVVQRPIVVTETPCLPFSSRFPWLLNNCYGPRLKKPRVLHRRVEFTSVVSSYITVVDVKYQWITFRPLINGCPHLTNKFMSQTLPLIRERSTVWSSESASSIRRDIERTSPRLQSGIRVLAFRIGLVVRRDVVPGSLLLASPLHNGSRGFW